MNEKTAIVAALFAVLTVGFIGIVGLVGESTGMTIKTTTHLGTRGCACDIYQYDYSGNLIGVQSHNTRVKTTSQLTDEACDNRCNIMFGRTKSGRKKVDGRVM